MGQSLANPAAFPGSQHQGRQMQSTRASSSDEQQQDISSPMGTKWGCPLTGVGEQPQGSSGEAAARDSSLPITNNYSPSVADPSPVSWCQLAGWSLATAGW